MRITQKGQVTIPIEIRQRLGMLPETEVAFEVDGNAVRIVKVRSETSRGARAVAGLAGRASQGWTTEEILALTRGD
ncbi:MAG: AbrB/MazE/SpoVT family DNA-binding domain-containing protein [Thermoanaerobaculia bacterium]|nr:AbrB/MazE/SpoVT family DNA-binding domain-containing protein [Thermoanaerobaculia bacterium]